MIVPSYEIIIVFALFCVPLSWALPRDHALDAVSVWTMICITLLAPATALWLALIAVGLPILISRGALARGPVIAAVMLIVIGGLVVSRTLPDWGWIGVAYVTLRALHVLLEGWMGRITTLTVRDSLHYIFFLPALAAGPVNRLPHFQHQVRRRRWDVSQFFAGAERVGLGLLWIYVVAGRLLTRIAYEIDANFDGAEVEWWALWSGSAIGWVQLYFTFAGTTHVALGIALMMGLVLEENFDRPWAARNLPEFWTRWHMTLTHWVRDYVFRPVMALTRSPVTALVLAMLVVGLWHAFSLYYVLWAVWQSLGIIVSRLMMTRVPVHMPLRATQVLGPIFNLAWLSAAVPVMALLGVSP